jgi:hypothetical protein
MITVAQDAPLWAQQLVRQVNADIATASLGPFVSRAPFLKTSMPDATKNAWKLAFVSNGTGNKFIAVSNGVAWFYPEGTAV